MKQSKLITGGLAALDRELQQEEWREARYTVLVDEATFQHCLPLLVDQVEALQEADFMEVPTGEEAKCLEVAGQLWQTLIEGGATRDHVLVCLGGGAVCDLGGFVAAGYMRGIRLIHVPTTLLAMADAAIGGKTALNVGGVKNSVGFFYPATLTVIDSTFLSTLPDEQLFCGWVEMVKTAAVCDAALYGRLIASARVPSASVGQVARLKSRIVKADPMDKSIRHILNFGHTFGHAIEVYASLPHGIAVGIGMAAAMYLSVKKMGLEVAVLQQYVQWLTAHVDMPHFTLRDVEAMLPLMRRDKKNSADEVRCVLLAELGAAAIDVVVDDNEVRDALLRLPRLAEGEGLGM